MTIKRALAEAQARRSPEQVLMRQIDESMELGSGVVRRTEGVMDVLSGATKLSKLADRMIDAVNYGKSEQELLGLLDELDALNTRMKQAL